MLGKRPHQMQRTTSMSQLRAAPGSRSPRPTNMEQFHSIKKDPNLPQKKGTACLSPGVKAVGADHSSLPKQDGCHGSGNHGDAVLSLAAMHARQAKPFLRPYIKDVPCNSTVESFLDACYYCKRPLAQGIDIFIYRGDAAFCTEECRFRQMSNEMLASQQCNLKIIGTSQ